MFQENEISINQLYETLQSVSDKNIEAIANFLNTILIRLALIGSWSQACCDAFIIYQWWSRSIVMFSHLLLSQVCKQTRSKRANTTVCLERNAHLIPNFF